MQFIKTLLVSFVAFQTIYAAPVPDPAPQDFNTVECLALIEEACLLASEYAYSLVRTMVLDKYLHMADYVDIIQVCANRLLFIL
jgi:hypothetical protein